ncbi:MAG: hypothetical protein ACRYGL_02610 [Janthinobacterium lividum]
MPINAMTRTRGSAVAIPPPALPEMELAAGLVHVLKTFTRFSKPGMYISCLRAT